MDALWYKTVNTPLGKLVLGTNGSKLTYANFDNGIVRPQPATRKSSIKPSDSAQKLFRICEQQLKSYFAGNISALERVPVEGEGTAFQKNVWRALTRIPSGKTRSYLELAQKVGSPKAFRAVGTACGKNPLVLFVPCHRAVASNGGLGGFSAGIHRKKYLLKLEGGAADLL